MGTDTFRTVDENLSRSATSRGEHPALKIGGEVVGYRTLNQLVDSTAAFLQRDLGLTPGERVLVLLSNGLEFVTTYYAIMRAGGEVVPVNPRSVPREIGHFLDDAKPCLVVSDADNLASVSADSLRKLRGGIVLGKSAVAERRSEFSGRWEQWADVTREYRAPEPVKHDGSATALIGTVRNSVCGRA